MMRFVRGILLFSTLALSMHFPTAFGASGDVPARVQALNALLADHWEWVLRESPEFATILGDYRYNSRWSDISLKHTAARAKDTAGFLERFKAIDTAGFAEQDRLNQELMVRQLQENVQAFAFKTHEMPIDQFGGTHLQLAQFVDVIPFQSTKHYEDYLARLEKVPELFSQLEGVLRQGAQDQLMPPRFLLEKVVQQCRDVAGPAGEANAFGRPVTRFPDGVPSTDRERLRDGILKAVNGKVRPAYVKFAQFVEQEYAPKGRSEPGVWSLPNGDERYRFAIQQLTTTHMDPQAVHELGLSEVARIEAEQTAIARKLGYADLRAMRAALRSDPKVRATSREQLIGLFQKYISQMQDKLPELFGLLPKTRLEVLPVHSYREKEAAMAEYMQGTPDGARPGKVYVNTGNFAERMLLTVESTAYHEGVPGHHMQISIAQTLPELPPFRQQAGYNAYAEGWALYAERLGKDVGFYQDPISDFGRLSDELLRADRLVLDTGVHFKHWTREQMVEFFREHSSEDEPNIQAETDRYIAWPAQALCYKLGQLKILELREKAQKALGDKFDIRAFHDEILNGGALPLDVLEKRTLSWLESRNTGRRASAGTASPAQF